MNNAPHSIVTFLETGQVTELRALQVSTAQYRKPHTVSGFFDHDHLEALTQAAQELSGSAKGVYFIPNPLNPALLARRNNRVDVADSGSLAADKDVLRRHWLLIDADPVRLEGVSATEAEKGHALEVSTRLREFLATSGWPAPVFADSGNGYHQLFRIDLPADDGELVKRVLQALAARFDDEHVKIDPKVFNPSRIVKLPGTWARKGENLTERPHRRAELLTVPSPLQIVPRDCLEAIAIPLPAPQPARPAQTADPRGRMVDRAVKYLDKIPGAISGQGGHDQTFKAACALILGYGMTVDEALPFLRAWNDRCQPPWNERELVHKLEDAAKQPGERGYLCSGERFTAAKSNGVHVNGAAHANGIPKEKPKPLVLDEYKPFPVEALPPILRQYVRQAALAIDCEPAYVAMPALAAVAGLIGNARTIYLKRGWEEPSVLWSVVVALSGSRKSPGFDAALGHIYATEKTLSDEYRRARESFDQDLEDYQQAKQKARHDREPCMHVKPEEPVRKRRLVGNITIEALAEMLEDNPRGILVGRQELAGWFGGFTRYSKNGSTDLQHWLEMHRASVLIIDRKTGDRRNYFVPRAATSVTGTIQPGILVRSLTNEFTDSGLAARLLMAMPPRRKNVWSELEVDPEIENAFHRLLDWLMNLEMPKRDGQPYPIALRMSPDAKASWVRFYDKWGYKQIASEGDLAAAFSKLEGYTARFALLFHVVKHAAMGTDDKVPIGQESIEAAVTLTRWFEREDRRIYALLSETEEDRGMRTLLEFIAGTGGRITPRQLQRSNNRKYPRTGNAEGALQALVELGCGEWVEVPGSERGGRPSHAFTLHDKTDKTPETGIEEDECTFEFGDKTPPEA